MCESTYVPQGARAAIPRPRWGRLYGVVVLGVAGLTAVDIVAPAVARTSLETVVVLGCFVAIALWVGGNRAALDQQAWCDCAAATVTVRVIRSPRPLRASEVSRAGIALDPSDWAHVTAPFLDASYSDDAVHSGGRVLVSR